MLPRVFRIVSVCLASALLWAGTATAESTTGVSTYGISARFIPDQVRPGDVVEFRVEMSRKAWGQFDLQVPAHPGLHPIAVKKVPLVYADGLYQQRESLLCQPVSSGSLAIKGASVVMSTPEGSQTVELPDLMLRVLPFEHAQLTDEPQPLPPNQHPAERMMPAFWFRWTAIVLCLLIWVVAIYFLRRKSTLRSEGSRQQIFQTSDVVQQLHTGEIPKHDLESLLNDPGLVLSEKLRTSIERAVYSRDIQPAELATLLQEELPA